jgi:ankyrin repeat protein
VTGPYQQVQEFSELDPLESLQSPLSGVGNNGNSNLLQDLSHHLVTLAAQLEDGHANVYRPGRDLMDVDEEYKPSTLHNPSQLEMQTRGLVAPGYSHQSQASAQSGHQSHHNTRHMSAQGGSFFNDNDSEKSDEGEQAHDSHHPIKRYDAAPFPPRSAEVFPRWVDRQVGNASNGERGQFEGLRGIASHQNNSMVPQQTIGASVAHRASADSGYVSNTNSIQSTGVGYLHSSPPASNLINTLNQGPNGQDLAYQKIALHSISCPENHQGMGFNYHCCGSSCLQELALLAVNMLPEQVYQYLYNYMLWEGMRLYDHAGNTFLHKLAVTGAPWAYFKAGFKARIDPCHRNAYEQTFAHVLNVSAFQDNLIECLSSLRELGVDFGLRDASGRTILHCLYSQPMSPHTAREILKLIEEPGRQLSLRDVYGQTPCEIFKYTFLQQASINPRWSATEPQLQMLGTLEDIVDGGVLRLKDEGVDLPGVTDNPGESRAALQNQYNEVIENAQNGIVVEAADGSNAFHAQAALVIIHEAPTDLCSLEKFISSEINTNDYDNEGRTPLEATITQPRDYETELTTSEKVSLLIDKGKASVHSRNRLGHTPLYSAAIRGLNRTVEALLLRGSHVNIRANDGQSLLRAVTDAGHRAFVEYCESGYCRYHEAQCSRIEECKVLLERYGAVLDPTPAQAMGYAVVRRPSHLQPLPPPSQSFPTPPNCKCTNFFYFLVKQECILLYHYVYDRFKCCPIMCISYDVLLLLFLRPRVLGGQLLCWLQGLARVISGLPWLWVVLLRRYPGL